LLVAIHQPVYLPWLGFLDKAKKADTFVLLDSVLFTRGSVINRNRIKTKRGPIWLTVPVHHRSDTLIQDVETVDCGWEKRHWKSLVCNYSRASHFGEFSGFFEKLYRQRWCLLSVVNETIIRFLFECFDIHPKVVKASNLKVQGKSSQLLVNICKAVGASTYLCGMGSAYLNTAIFEREGIGVQFQKFVSPVYPQLFGGAFTPNLSAVDYLFNCGAKSSASL